MAPSARRSTKRSSDGVTGMAQAEQAAGTQHTARSQSTACCSWTHSPAKQLTTNRAGSSARRRGADRAAVGYQVTEAGAGRHFFLS